MRSLWHYEFPIGPLGIVEQDNFITSVFFGNAVIAGFDSVETDLIKLTAIQLTEYFEKRRQIFDVPLLMHGTDFQVSVWNALSGIPYGETRSYKDIAEQVNRPRAYRAVGAANGRNPVAIIVPCHRVVGSNASLIGYGGGLDIKQYLLELESLDDQPPT
jgi:methylated-DNA-[protein]-cysteine S-methyltransferase